MCVELARKPTELTQNTETRPHMQIKKKVWGHFGHLGTQTAGISSTPETNYRLDPSGVGTVFLLNNSN